MMRTVCAHTTEDVAMSMPSSASAVQCSCYFHGVRHPSCGLPNQCKLPHRCTTARKDIGRPPPSQHQACPGFHGSSTSPRFSRARGVRAGRIFHHRSVSCTNSHTKVRCCIPSTCQRPSSAVVKMLRNVRDPTSKSGFALNQATHELSCDQVLC